ncbi:MAG: DUF3502 domain-containing protein [Bacteroidota bacterium]|nr:DUF3502 domain-containing protein [Bacteroidota bacterium]
MAKRKSLITISLAVFITFCILTTIYLISINAKRNDSIASNSENNNIGTNLKETKLTFYFEAQEQSIKEILNQVESKANLNAKLDFKFITEDTVGYLSEIKNIIASGQPCDAFYYSAQFSEDLRSLVNDKIAKDISKAFPQYAPDYYNKLSKQEKSLISVDGKIYAVPNRMPSTQMRCAFVREDLMKKYNIPDIKSYDDYEIFLKTIKQYENDIIPMTYADSSIGLFAEANGYVILNYRQGLVYKWNDPDMKLLAWEQTPEFKKGIETISSWFAKGYLAKDCPTVQIDQNVLLSGKWASAISVFGSDIEYFNYSLVNKNTDWKYKECLLYPDEISARTPQINNYMVISESSNNAERALMFVEWLQADQENYDSLMYGIKDKNYALVNDCIKLPENISQNESYTSWVWRAPFMNIDYERANVSEPVDIIKNYYNTLKEKTKYPPHTGFIPNYSVVDDIADYRKLSYNSLEQKIYNGTFLPEDVEIYINDQKAKGADNLVAEIQKQLDKWKSEK